MLTRAPSTTDRLETDACQIAWRDISTDRRNTSHQAIYASWLCPLSPMPSQGLSQIDATKLRSVLREPDQICFLSPIFENALTDLQPYMLLISPERSITGNGGREKLLVATLEELLTEAPMTNHSSSLPLPLCAKATTLELNSLWPFMNAFKIRTSCPLSSVSKATSLSPPGPSWQALVIDDFFCLSAERRSLPATSTYAFKALAWARDAYERHRLEGSPEKDVVAERRFKGGGAEVDSREAIVDLGLVSVSAPLAKRVGLSTLSLRAARLRWIQTSLLPGWLAIGSPLSFIGVAGRVSLRSSSPSLPSVNASLRMPSSHFQPWVCKNTKLNLVGPVKLVISSKLVFENIVIWSLVNLMNLVIPLDLLNWNRTKTAPKLHHNVCYRCLETMKSWQANSKYMDFLLKTKQIELIYIKSQLQNNK